MKYIRRTVYLFLFALIFSMTNVKGLSSVFLNDTTIPPFQLIFYSKQREKQTHRVQEIIKLNSTSNRVVVAKNLGMGAGMTSSDWIETKTTLRSFGSQSVTIGPWKVLLKTKYTQFTNTYFNGTWYY